MKTLDTFRLDGQVALVTGGARTLGWDMAEALGEAGAALVVTSRDAAQAETAAARLREAPGVEAIGFGLDVRDPGRVAEVVSAARDWKGRLDVLVNNAGGGFGTGHNLVVDGGFVPWH